MEKNAIVKLPSDVAEHSLSPYVLCLGIAQDGGYPQTGCTLDCCQRAWLDRKLRRLATSLGLVDPVTGEKWLFEATPDIKEQVRALQEASTQKQQGQAESSPANGGNLAGVFITHAHIGHYTGTILLVLSHSVGLLQLGKEAWSTSHLPLHVMPRMHQFLCANEPWAALVRNENVRINEMQSGVEIRLNDRLSVRPFLVTHRGEYSETVGFEIACSTLHSAKRHMIITFIRLLLRFVFIPDIDSWKDFEDRLIELIEGSDYVFIDGTFFKDNELLNRDMGDIPHPRISESLRLFQDKLERKDQAKVHFIHLNHTNPCLDPSSAEHRIVQVCQEGTKYFL